MKEKTFCIVYLTTSMDTCYCWINAETEVLALQKFKNENDDCLNIIRTYETHYIKNP